MLKTIQEISSKLGLSFSGTTDSETIISQIIDSQVGAFKTLQDLAFATGHIIQRKGSSLVIQDKIALINQGISKTLDISQFDKPNLLETESIKEIKIEWSELAEDGVVLKSENKSINKKIGNTGTILSIPKVTNNPQHQLDRISSILNYENIQVEVGFHQNIKLFQKIKCIGLSGDTDLEFVITGINYNFGNTRATLKGFGNAIYK